MLSVKIEVTGLNKEKMSINKRMRLGSNPTVLGEKDAIHTAIVSVRAGQVLSPGEKVKLNEKREAIRATKDSVGVVDPFLKGKVYTGENFWLLVNLQDIPNVQHVWEHPSVDFSAPTAEVEKCPCIQETANMLKVSYEDLLTAATKVADGDGTTVHPSLTDEELEALDDEGVWDDFWYYFQEELDYEFENVGSACCPEYDYPEYPYVGKNE